VESPSRRKIFVLDASSIIAFLSLSKGRYLLEYLSRDRELLVTREVVEEVTKQGDELRELEEQGIIRIVEARSMIQSPVFMLKLGKGEISCISLCKELQKEGLDAVCVLDDKQARNSADKLQVRKIGTIGLLKLMVEEGYLTNEDLHGLCRELQYLGFRFKWSLCTNC